MFLPIEKYGTIKIIGNGPGNFPEISYGSPYVTFNRPTATDLQTGEISISNRKVSGLDCDSPPFIVVSRTFSVDFCMELQRELLSTAVELKSSLGCLPSVGLTTFFVLSRITSSLEVFKMTLCPGLERPSGMPERKPLPAAFHNWLGERRLALQRCNELSHQLSWPQLYLPINAQMQDVGSQIDPFITLFDWFSRYEGCRSMDVETDVLRSLIYAPISAWISSCNVSQLIEIERFFFLSRDEHETLNWWLYRNSITKLIDTIHLRLMSVQQSLIC